MAKYTAIGGQALIEGIMMKSPEKTAIGVRLPDDTIDITYMDEQSLKQKYKIFGFPIIRGVVSFIESLVNGYKALMLSADKSGFTDIEEETNENNLSEEIGETEENGEAKEKNEAKDTAQKTDTKLLVSIAVAVGTVLGVVLSIVLFMLIPRLFVSLLEKVFSATFSRLARSSVEQLLKLAVFVLYVWLVSFMKDIKRVFMYHGAEHKTIFCYEKGLPLTVENVRIQRRFHPRCGTSFMILMILVSIIFSTVVQMIFPKVYDLAFLWVLIKILLVPLVCGAGYEILKICGKYDNVITKIISAPGLWLQRITTKEPEDCMIEVAIAALKACEPEVPDVDRSIDKVAEDTENNDNI